VLEFGIALRLGVGKEFNKGVLVASLSLSLYGIFEGRLAFSAPRSKGGRRRRCAGTCRRCWRCWR
jgi:hypothetical protein